MTAYLQDQLKRALASVLLNIAEGNGRTGPLERRRFFTIARGSAAEVGAVLDVAQAFGLVTQEIYIHWQEGLLRIVKMLSKLR